jgi:hypothetical protein
LPGKITDELRRITREQGGAAPPSANAPAVPEPKGKRYGPLIALGVVLVLSVVGWILVQKVMDMSRIQDCAMAGRKNCAPINTDGTGP